MGLKQLVAQQEKLESLTNEEGSIMLGLRPDRADVIVPAAGIYINAMTWSKINSIHVPKLGLADGMIMRMHLDNKAKV